MSNDPDPGYSSCAINGPFGKVVFGITQLPNRKCPCLYRMRGAMLEPLAYFRCEADAAAFNMILDTIIEAWDGQENDEVTCK